MKEIIKTLIAKIKLWRLHYKCYNEMEGKAIAVFGMCSGKWYKISGAYEVPYKQCSICPYFRDIRSNNNE